MRHIAHNKVDMSAYGIDVSREMAADSTRISSSQSPLPFMEVQGSAATGRTVLSDVTHRARVQQRRVVLARLVTTDPRGPWSRRAVPAYFTTSRTQIGRSDKTDLAPNEFHQPYQTKHTGCNSASHTP